MLLTRINYFRERGTLTSLRPSVDEYGSSCRAYSEKKMRTPYTALYV